MAINTSSTRYIPELAMIELNKTYLYIIISLEGEITQARPASMDTNPDIFYTEADSLVLCEQKAVSCKKKIMGFDKKTGFMSAGHTLLTLIN